MQQHRPRNVEGPQDQRWAERRKGFPHRPQKTPCTCVITMGEPCRGGETGVTRKPNGWMLGGDLLFVLSVGHPTSSRSPALLAPCNPHTFSSSGQEKRFLKPA